MPSNRKMGWLIVIGMVTLLALPGLACKQAAPETVSEILARAANVTQVKYDWVTPSPEGAQTTKVWVKGNKWRIEAPWIQPPAAPTPPQPEGTVETRVATGYLIDTDANIVYTLYSVHSPSGTRGNIVEKSPGFDPREVIDFVSAMAWAKVIAMSDPKIVGTETVDGKASLVVESVQGQTSAKAWIWKEHPFLVRMELTIVAGRTGATEVKNIEFGDIPDSVFEEFTLTTPTSVPTGMLTSKPTPTSAYEELLGLVPDTPETRSSVYISNFALIRDLFDFPLPASWTQGLPDYAALGPGAFVCDAYAASRSRSEASLLFRQYLGFDIRNEDQCMVAGVPPKRLEVVRGRFDPAATDHALKSCSGECTPPDARWEYQGIRFYSWGADFQADLQKRLAPPAFDQLGRGGRIAVLDKYMFRTLWTDGMKALIDASLGKGPSLADVEEYRLLAQGMSELGAYGMFLTDQTQGLDETGKAICEESSMSEQDCAKVRAQLENQPMLQRYQAFATGVGKDDKGAYTALVLVHGDAASAEANVGLLRRRIEEGESWRVRGTWAQFFDTDLMEVHTRDRVLLAKLRPTEGRRPNWIEWVFLRDPLLLHE